MKTSEQKLEFLKQDPSIQEGTVMQHIENSQVHQLFAHIKHISNAPESALYDAEKLLHSPR